MVSLVIEKKWNRRLFRILLSFELLFLKFVHIFSMSEVGDRGTIGTCIIHFLFHRYVLRFNLKSSLIYFYFQVPLPQQKKTEMTSIVKKSRPQAVTELEPKKSSQFYNENPREEEDLLIRSFDIGPDTFCPIDLVKIHREKRNSEAPKSANMRELRVCPIFHAVTTCFTWCSMHFRRPLWMVKGIDCGVYTILKWINAAHVW